MTTIVLNYSTNLLEKIWENLKGFGKSLLVARQISANRDIAEYLYRTGEYKSYHEALHVLNQRAREYIKNV